LIPAFKVLSRVVDPYPDSMTLWIRICKKMGKKMEEKTHFLLNLKTFLNLNGGI
jgi:hypothetical protein